MIKFITLLNEEIENQEKIPKYLELDLNNYHALPPRDGINITHAAFMLNTPVVCKSIDSSLKTGGILVIGDYIKTIEDMLQYFPNYTVLEFHMGYFDEKNINAALIVLKK
jgi:hypothetical protein